jgi:hypothetical protein
MTTLRECLTRSGFDWDTGFILWQPIKQDPESCYQISPGNAWEDDVLPTVEMPEAVLDEEFSSGYGAPEMPRFIAQDADHTYFPVQYDGATGVHRVPRWLRVGSTEPTPYPGG